MRIWILLIAVVFGFSACSEDKPTEEVTLPAPPNNEVSAPASLNSVYSPDAGVVRGIDFSMDRASVSSTEKSEEIESNDSSVMYSVDLNDYEFVDIMYSFAGGQLNQIEMDIYAENVEMASSYYDELVAYFNDKYLAREELWDGSVNGVPFTTFVQKVEDPENPGVLVFYEKMNESSAAVYGQ